jgi:hypothetical protein
VKQACVALGRHPKSGTIGIGDNGCTGEEACSLVAFAAEFNSLMVEVGVCNDEDVCYWCF